MCFVSVQSDLETTLNAIEQKFAVKLEDHNTLIQQQQVCDQLTADGVII